MIETSGGSPGLKRVEQDEVVGSPDFLASEYAIEAERGFEVAGWQEWTEALNEITRWLHDSVLPFDEVIAGMGIEVQREFVPHPFDQLVGFRCVRIGDAGATGGCGAEKSDPGLLSTPRSDCRGPMRWLPRRRASGGRQRGSRAVASAQGHWMHSQPATSSRLVSRMGLEVHAQYQLSSPTVGPQAFSRGLHCPSQMS